MNHFELGTIEISPGAITALAAADVAAAELIARHGSGDWGERGICRQNRLGSSRTEAYVWLYFARARRGYGRRPQRPSLCTGHVL